jgi:GLPGLI family protein
MQKLFLFAALMPIAQTLTAQSAPAPAAVLKEGRVIYERKVDMYRRLEDESAKAMIPQYNTSKAELDFTGDVSIYKNIKEEEDVRDHAGDEGNGRVMIRMGGGDDQTYREPASGKMIQQKELGPRKYIIEDTLPKSNWHLEEGMRTIKGYACKKASTTNRQGMNITAWYAEDIQSSSGPDLFGGLPGLILELNVNNGEIVYSAIDILTKDFDKSVVKAPSDGKKISGAEYRKMMEEQFGVKPGGGATIRIIRN